LAEIKDFKLDNNTVLRFLTLSSNNNQLNKAFIGAWRRVTGGKKDLALKIFNLLMISRKGEFTEELSKKLDEPIHNIRRSLNDLSIIGLIEKIKRKRNRVLSDFWRVKEKINGLLRLFPVAGANSGFFGNEEFWFNKYKEISKLFAKYTGYSWITKKNIGWKIEKNGLMKYNEERVYLKLSDVTPPVNYITLFAKSDKYDLRISGQNGKEFDITTEIYEHPNKKLNIVNALIPQDTFRNEFTKLQTGEVYNIKITDKKRLYACPKTKSTYMACFLYRINLENIDSLEIYYDIHENVSPMSCGIWFDNHKELEINLQTETSQKQENIKWKVQNKKNYLKLYWKGKFLLNKAQILKFLFEFEPKFESDSKQWIKLYQAVDCPFCQKIPFETIGLI